MQVEKASVEKKQLEQQREQQQELQRELLNSVQYQPKFRESDAGDGTRREDQILNGTRFYLCVISLILCMFLVALDQMITTAVLTTICDHFKAFDKIAWVIAAFMMPMGSCSQVWARLAISFGRKWVLLLGVVLFELGSLIVGVSNSMNMFIGGRTIQGIGGSAIQTCALIIATEITTIDNKPILFALLSVTLVVASAVGPVIGGVFGTYLTWRWCFYLNLCCGAIILPFFSWTYRPKPPLGTFREKLKTVDFLDSFLMMSSIVLLLLGLSFGQTGQTYRTASTISCFILGGLLLIAFLVDNFKYSKHPTIPYEVATNPKILFAFGAFSFNSCFMVVMQFLSIYFQNIIGQNPYHTGVSLIPSAATISVFGMLTGIVMKKARIIKPICLVGALLLPVSIGLMTLLGCSENVGYAVGFQILLGVSVGLNFQGPMMSALVNAPKTPGSSILTTAFIQFGRTTATALFSLIASAIYTSTLKTGIIKITPQWQETKYAPGDVVIQMGLLEKLNSHDKMLLQKEILVGVRNTFWLALGMSFVALVLTLCMSSKKVPKPGEVEA